MCLYSKTAPQSDIKDRRVWGRGGGGPGCLSRPPLHSNTLNSDKSCLLPAHKTLINLKRLKPHLLLFSPPSSPHSPSCWAPVGLTVPVQTVSSTQLSHPVSGPGGQTLPRRGEQTTTDISGSARRGKPGSFIQHNKS